MRCSPRAGTCPTKRRSKVPAKAPGPARATDDGGIWLDTSHCVATACKLQSDPWTVNCLDSDHKPARNLYMYPTDPARQDHATGQALGTLEQLGRKGIEVLLLELVQSVGRREARAQRSV